MFQENLVLQIPAYIIYHHLCRFKYGCMYVHVCVHTYIHVHVYVRVCTHTYGEKAWISVLTTVGSSSLWFPLCESLVFWVKFILKYCPQSTYMGSLLFESSHVENVFLLPWQLNNILSGHRILGSFFLIVCTLFHCLLHSTGVD